MNNASPGGRLAGRRALVTGAASGIGRAVAERFVADGAVVAGLDRNRDGLDAVSRLPGMQDAFHGYTVDLSDEPAVQSAVAASAERLGGIDTIAAVAGIELSIRGDDRVHLLSFASWSRTIESNLTGMFLTLKHGIGAILASGQGGSVIITGSPWGFCNNQHAYSASKAGVHGFVRPAAVDYAADGIRVNCVVPGFVETPLTRDLVADTAAMRRLTATIPARRPGRPDEIAPLYSWLASTEASYVTGAFFSADGGQLAL
jgi:NAD(P)-dependent dehydrogenase (short-subunit alcohol dehydrogenase family)